MLAGRLFSTYGSISGWISPTNKCHMPNEPSSILILGGCFNPPHIGHVEPVLFARTALSLERIIYVPTGISPHKRNKEVTPSEKRIAMLQLAIAHIPSCEIDPFETMINGVVYFYQTVEHISQKFPKAKIRFLIGSDWTSKFHLWRNCKRILELAEPVAMVRPGFPRPNATWKYGVVEVPEFKVSSTMLRERLSKRLYDDELVKKSMSPEVVAWVKERRLYEDAGNTL